MHEEGSGFHGSGNWAAQKRAPDKITMSRAPMRCRPVAKGFLPLDGESVHITVHMDFSIPVQKESVEDAVNFLHSLSELAGKPSRPAKKPTPAAFEGTPDRHGENRISQPGMANFLTCYLEAAIHCAKHLEMTDENARERFEFIRNLTSFARTAQRMTAQREQTSSNARQRKTTLKRKGRANRRRVDNGVAPRNAQPSAGHRARDAPEAVSYLSQHMPRGVD
jgi:hypothetical protein